MGKVVILDENTSNKIAAGEVIERPASVVKELVENSIDAGAGSVSVEIKNGGVSFIKVTDNGSGIEEDDAVIAFERHATSKIRSADDLESIATMGFRGEALASIAAVSTVELTTRVQKNPYGMYIKIQGGTTQEVKQTGCPVGTTFLIRDLFYNTPARFKFLKKDSTETGYISDILSRIALGNPQISFRLVNNGTPVLHTPGNNDLQSAIFSIYGRETAREIAEINYSDSKVKITGFAGKPEIARASRSHQTIFLNRRYIKSKVITSAIDEAYKTFLMKNKFAFVILNIEINPLLVDVNVHPTKMEVRFSEEQEIFRSVYHAIGNALMGRPLIKTVQVESEEQDFRFKETVAPPPKVYAQERLEVPASPVREATQQRYGYQNRVETKNNLYKTENNNTGAGTGIWKETEATGEVKEKLKELKEVKVVEEVKEVKEVKEAEAARTPENKEHAEDVSEESRSVFQDSRIIGQVFSTYVLLQHGEELILIDQHAAHERVMYERVLEKYTNREPLSQMLLNPVVLELTHQEIRFLEDRREFFNSLGFIYENFGSNAVILRSVPYSESGESVREMFLEVLDTVMHSDRTDEKALAGDALYTIACKAAVKANQRLDDMEIESLLKEMAGMKNPYTCPHGRPTVVRLTKHQIEKMFKRVL